MKLCTGALDLTCQDVNAVSFASCSSEAQLRASLSPVEDALHCWVSSDHFVIVIASMMCDLHEDMIAS